MAPKKKGGKKQADDWENELGETVDPIAQATEDANKAEVENDGAEEMNGGGGGGLMDDAHAKMMRQQTYYAGL